MVGEGEERGTTMTTKGADFRQVEFRVAKDRRWAWAVIYCPHLDQEIKVNWCAEFGIFICNYPGWDSLKRTQQEQIVHQILRAIPPLEELSGLKLSVKKEKKRTTKKGKG